MSGPGAISLALIAAAVGLELLACAGVSSGRAVYDRLHFLAPAALGCLCLCAAIVVREGPSLIALKAALVAAFTVFGSPLTAHVIMRAARIAERGHWRTDDREGGAEE